MGFTAGEEGTFKDAGALEDSGLPEKRKGVEKRLAGNSRISLPIKIEVIYIFRASSCVPDTVQALPQGSLTGSSHLCGAGAMISPSH